MQTDIFRVDSYEFAESDALFVDTNNRVFMIKADLYYKEFKDYKYLEPLPFHGMSDYPPPAPEAYPTDADHNQYRLLYNTRVVSP